MRKKSTNVSEAGLMLEILKLIPTHRKITQSEIKASLKELGYELSKRKLERTMVALVEMGSFGIECDKRARPYGYSQRVRNGGISLGDLSDPECLVILLAEEYLKYQLPKEIFSSASNIFNFARQKFERMRNANASKWISKVAFVSDSLPMKSPNILPRIFSEISSAIYEGKQIRGIYKGLDGLQKEKLLSPYGIVQQGCNIYIVAKDELNDGNIKNYAVHRFVKVEKLNSLVNIPEDFNLDEYVSSRHFNYMSHGRKIRLEFNFKNRAMYQYLTETPINDTQQIFSHSDGTFSLRVDDLDDSTLVNAWLAKWEIEGGPTEIKKTLLN